TVTAIDPDIGQTLSYFIAGGADAAKFTIDSTTGVLAFVTAPNFEAPTDANGNNVYDVIVRASDPAGNAPSQAIAVTVTNVNEAPVITSDGGGDTASISLTENSSNSVTTVTAIDPDIGQTLSYSITGGADAAKFIIVGGQLRFAPEPGQSIGFANFEAPTDANHDNIYDVTVQVSDGNGGIDT